MYKKRCFRIIILVIVLFLPIIIYELILTYWPKEKSWEIEDKIINAMNNDKLNQSSVGYNCVLLHKGEELPKKKEGTKRIFIIGDSFIWGDGYSNINHTWWKQLKHMLKEQGYDNVEIVAAGISGYNTKQELDFILKDKETIEMVEPDYIIIGYYSNDPEFKDENGKSLVKFVDTDDINYVKNNKLLNIVKGVIPNVYSKVSTVFINKYSNKIGFSDIVGLDYYGWLEVITSGEWLEKYENEVIIPLKQYLEEELKIPYIFYITTLDDKEPGLKRIMNLFDKYNFKYYCPVNLNNYIEVVKGGPININPANAHPSVYRANIFAKYLLEILQKNYPEWIGEKNGYYTPKFEINDWMPFRLNPIRLSDKSYKITYPGYEFENSFLYFPIKKDYIKLNLEDPINLNKIKITGENIKEIDVYINTINSKKGYDDQEMQILEKINEYEWKINTNELITSINIHAKINYNKEQDLIITVE